MSSLLSCSVLTDPSTLTVSQTGAPSLATVYVIVSNAHATKVRWESIDVEIANGTTELTPQDPTRISTRVDIDYPPQRREEAPVFGWNATDGVFRAEAPSGMELTIPRRGSIVLVLRNLPVSSTEGLVRLKLHEWAEGGEDGAPLMRRVTTVGLVKQAPRVPRNFRPEKSLLEDGKNVTLLWEGPSNLDYWILDPDGQKILAHPQTQGAAVTQRAYRWSPPTAPTRGTTYTLLATTSPDQEQGCFLTTTVHPRIPEFDSGTRTPWVEGTAGRGRVVFSPAGVDIRNEAGAGGTVAADSADITTGVRTSWVWGRNDSDGWINFPSSGINVYHGPQHTWGAVSAEKLDVNSLEIAHEIVANDLTIRDKLTTRSKSHALVVHRSAVFQGRLDANANLVVRDVEGKSEGEDNIMLVTHDDRVVVHSPRFHVMGMISCRSREWEQH